MRLKKKFFCLILATSSSSVLAKDSCTTANQEIVFRVSEAEAKIELRKPEADSRAQKILDEVFFRMGDKDRVEAQKISEEIHANLDAEIGREESKGPLTKRRLSAAISRAILPILDQTKRIAQSFRLRPFCFGIGAVIVNSFILTATPDGMPRYVVLVVTNTILGTYIGNALAGFNSIMGQLSSPTPTSNAGFKRMPYWLSRIANIEWWRKGVYDDFTNNARNDYNASKGPVLSQLAPLTFPNDLTEGEAAAILAYAAKDYRRFRSHFGADNSDIGDHVRALIRREYKTQKMADATAALLFSGIDPELDQSQPTAEEAKSFYQTLLTVWLGQSPTDEGWNNIPDYSI